jgi:DnaK suppressor protein
MDIAKKFDPKATGLSTETIRKAYPEFTEILNQRRENILKRANVDRLQLDEQVMTSPGDVADISIADSSVEYLWTFADVYRRELLEISEAIDRMHRGVYGVCGSCGNEINIERLRRLPYARLCVDCQSIAEARGNVRRIISFHKP